MGPFVVSQLTSNGAVWLETLDGAKMPNFINGSRLKKYEQPLTDEMLKWLHVSKTYKEGQVQLKAAAQREARERREKMQPRRATIMVVSTDNQDELDEPCI